MGRAEILIRVDERQLLEGEITKEQFLERQYARGQGALAAVSFFVPGPEELVIVSAARAGGKLISGIASRLGLTRAVRRGTSGAENAANRVRLQKQLASEQQVGEVLSGSAERMAGAGSRRQIDDVNRLVSQYGGEAGDWAKVRSSSSTAADGTRFEIHAYQNVRTGEVFELKTKFQ